MTTAAATTTAAVTRAPVCTGNSIARTPFRTPQPQEQEQQTRRQTQQQREQQRHEHLQQEQVASTATIATAAAATTVAVTLAPARTGNAIAASRTAGTAMEAMTTAAAATTVAVTLAPAHTDNTIAASHTASVDHPLPPGWAKHYCKAWGRSYYYNATARTTQWEEPCWLPQPGKESFEGEEDV